MSIKVYEALNWASSFLLEKKYEREIGQILLMHHLNVTRSSLFARMQEEVRDDIWEAFQRDVKRAGEEHVPVQHITGKEEFYGRTFKVTEDTLIPRPETEELVVAVLEGIRGGKHDFSNKKLLDIGTGSGVLAVTLKRELGEKWHVMGSDLSKEALLVARENADALGADVEFVEGDLLQPFLSKGVKAEVIVSNPPYIPEGDKAWMGANVIDYEPHLALFAGADGLHIYRRLLKELPNVLTSPGLVAFEIGHDQGLAVAGLMKESFPLAQVKVKKDINGNERIVLAWV